jgi:hypothetical protein
MRCAVIACCVLFALVGCAYDESELVDEGEIAAAQGEETRESAPSEEELAASEALAAEAIETSEPTDEELAAAAVSPRYMIGDGCRTFDYLRYWSNWYCRQVWSASSRATSRDYSIACSNGAKYVSFVCVGG